MFRKKYREKFNKKEAMAAYICLAPALLLAVVFVVIPLINVFYLSFTNWDLIKTSKKFIGLKNYFYIFSDSKFLKSMLNTLIFAGVKIPLDLFLSLFIAILLDKKIFARRFFRASYFAPVVLPMVAATLIWIWIYDPTFGPLNQILGFFGVAPIRWLYDPGTSMLSVILFSLWKGLGYDIVIFLAGLQAIPETYSEAAKIDGGNSRQIFFKITLPLLSPIVYFVILMGIINSFKVFTQISVMTPEGGPLYSTGVMVFYIYQQAFENFKIGRASAAAVILFLMILALTAVQRKAGHKHVHYE
jgi:ABC-type sugar transport system permease subunit